MTKLISTELGPNHQLGDSIIAKLSLLGLVNTNKAQNIATKWFRNYLNLDSSQPLFFTDNGRTSLYLLLKSLNLEPQSEVLIQGFSCVVLPNSVWGADLKPILVDCDETNFNLDLQDLDKKLTSKTKVVVIQYTFGVVPNMDEIIDFCGKNNLILIEDVAHSLGCKASYKGKQYNVGTLGQAAFFSFGRDKNISTTRGGFGYINPKPVFKTSVDAANWAAEFEINYNKLPEMKFKNVVQTLLYPILTTIFIRPFYHLYLGKIILFFSRKLSLIGSIYTKFETIGTKKIETASKYPQKLYPLLANQLKKIDKFNNHRIELCKIYSKELGLPNYDNQPLLRYPVDLKMLTKDYKQNYPKIILKLRQNGILVGQWYTSLFMQPKMNYWAKFDLKTTDLKTAFSLSDRRIINLPTNIYVTKQNALLICSLIKEFRSVD